MITVINLRVIVMNRIGLRVSLLRHSEMDWDNFFADRINGAIGLSKALIAKQAIALQGLNVQESEFAAHFDQSEKIYIEECIKDYNKCLSEQLKAKLKNRSYKRLTDEKSEYGIDYRLSEIKELYEERLQRKIDLNLAFVQILKDSRAKRTSMRLAVTGG